MSYISALSSIGIIFALGHFYFGYKYFILKNSLIRFISILLISTALAYLWFLFVNSYFLTDTTLVFYTSVILAFVFHNAYDFYKFGYKKNALFWLLAGSVVTFFFFKAEGALQKSIVYTLVWGSVFTHYYYWMVLSKSRLPAGATDRFLNDLIISHTVIVLIYLVNVFFLKSAILAIAFSIPLFFFLTLVHIIFSLIKDFDFKIMRLRKYRGPEKISLNIFN